LKEAFDDITDEMLDKVSFGEVTVTRRDLLQIQSIDPMIEMDPDAVHSVLRGKIGGDFSLQIFTDNINRFKELWNVKNLQILIIASATQIIVATQDIMESFRAREVFAVQQ